MPANVTALNATIDNIYAAPGQATNWDAALQAAAQAKGFAPNGTTGQTANPDEVVFITDGNPTVNDTDEGGDGSNVDLFNVTAAMASANLVKNQDARPAQGAQPATKLKMLALGVDNEAGSAPTVGNLEAVSGPIEGVDGDYAAPTISELDNFLAELAAAQCGARVFIRKFLENDQTNQADWGYGASDPPGDIPAPIFQDGDPRTHGPGIETGAFYNLLPSTPTSITISEDATGQPEDPFQLTGVVCRDGGYEQGAVVPGNLSGLDYTFDVDRGDDIYCTFENRVKTTLEVTKTPNDQTINAGEVAEFTIEVENTGTLDATNATLSDQLPAPGVGGWTVTQQPAGGNCSVNGANLLTCVFNDIPAGQTRTLKVETGTSFSICGIYDNPIATADADNADPVEDAGKITCQRPDLTVEKTGNGLINAGDDVVFDITVTNNGPGTATDVTLSDTLPGGVAGPWVLSGTDAAACQPFTSPNLDCDFGDLPAAPAPGSSKTVTVTAPTDNDNCETYENTAFADASNHPEVDDAAQVACLRPGLQVSKVASNATINAGEDVQFDILVSNLGQGTATDVTLTDTLPGGVAGDWVLSGADAADCQPFTSPNLDCDFGDLGPGELQDRHGHRANRLRQLRHLQQHRRRRVNQCAARQRRRDSHVPEA